MDHSQIYHLLLRGDYADLLHAYASHPHHSKALLRVFQMGDAPRRLDKLRYEFAKLHGIREREWRQALAQPTVVIPDTPPISSPDDADTSTSSTQEEPAPQSPADAESYLMTRRYPFLANPDTPAEVLEVAHLRLDAWHALMAARADLFTAFSEQECMEAAERAIKAEKTNRALWAELDHYATHGVMLYKAPGMEDMAYRHHYAHASALELGKQLNSLNSMIARYKDDPQRVARYTSQRDYIASLLESK